MSTYYDKFAFCKYLGKFFGHKKYRQIEAEFALLSWNVNNFNEFFCLSKIFNCFGLIKIRQIEVRFALLSKFLKNFRLEKKIRQIEEGSD